MSTSRRFAIVVAAAVTCLSLGVALFSAVHVGVQGSGHSAGIQGTGTPVAGIQGSGKPPA